MSRLGQFLAQAFGPPVAEQIYTSDATITVDDEVFGMIMLIGGGGSGAKSVGDVAVVEDRNQTYCATGGNAGGLAVKTLRFIPGVNYAFVSGAGALGRATTTDEQDGLQGSNSTFISNDGIHSVTAYGGNGGNQSSPTGSLVVSPNALSSGVGGDFHYNGGRGGTITAVAPAAGSIQYCASGGGAVNLRGVLDENAKCRGGGIILNTAGVGDRSATGGGGVGGSGGALKNNTGATIYAGTGGGGSGAPATGYVGYTGSIAGVGGAIFEGDFGVGEYSQPRGLGGDGGTGSTVAENGESGGGGGGTSTTSGYSAGDGGRFGGGGGLCASDITAGSERAGNGGAGAGGGGLACTAADAGNASGAGGDGLLIVRFFAIARNVR